MIVSELLPSVTRVFHRQQPLFAYLQAYERGSGPIQPLAVYPSFYQDGGLVYAAPARAVPVRIALSLNRLPPGEYTLQLSIIAPRQIRRHSGAAA